MSLEETLTARDEINSQLRGELDKVTGGWGIRVARVEIKAIEPPASIQESMERQMKADREKRADDPHRRGPAGVGDPQRGGQEAEPDPHRGGREAGGHPQRRGRSAVAHPAGPGRARGPVPAGAGRGEGDREGVRGDQVGAADPRAARLPVPADAPADGAGRREQGVDRAVGLRQGAGGLHEDARRARRRRRVPVRAVAGGGHGRRGRRTTTRRSRTGSTRRRIRRSRGSWRTRRRRPVPRSRRVHAEHPTRSHRTVAGRAAVAHAGRSRRGPGPGGLPAGANRHASAEARPCRPIGRRGRRLAGLPSVAPGAGTQRLGARGARSADAPRPTLPGRIGRATGRPP